MDNIEYSSSHESRHCLCDCGSYEHQFHFDWWDDGEERHLYLTVHLASRPFWERVKHGIAYIFGHRCRYGDFDEVVLGRKQAKVFKEIADRLETVTDE